MSRVVVCILTLSTLGLGGCHKELGTKSQSLNAETKMPVRKRPIEAAAFNGPTGAWIVTGERNLLHTHDGGVTWETTAAESVGGFQCVSFIDGQRGWTINDHGLVWSTQDGGGTWRMISSIGNGGGLIIGQIKFESEQIGWMLEPLSVWRTTDGGVSWTQKEYNTLLADAAFVNDQVAWVFDQDNRVFFHTSDGGKTSEVRDTPGQQGDGDLLGVYCFSKNAGWLTRGRGWPEFGNTRLYRTQDGGQSWQTRKIPGHKTIMDAVYFRSDREGWVAGSEKIPGMDHANGFSALLLHTLDGGESWEIQTTGVRDLSYDAVYFADALRGWLRGHDKVYRTDDSGKSWTVVLNLER
jgi:photosystem II stability/assembly factor-like uncharacterized protein